MVKIELVCPECGRGKVALVSDLSPQHSGGRRDYWVPPQRSACTECAREFRLESCDIVVEPILPDVAKPPMTRTCGLCLKDPATVHVTGTLDGMKREAHLCVPCAETFGVGIKKTVAPS